MLLFVADRPPVSSEPCFLQKSAKTTQMRAGQAVSCELTLAGELATITRVWQTQVQAEDLGGWRGGFRRGLHGGSGLGKLEAADEKWGIPCGWVGCISGAPGLVPSWKWGQAFGKLSVVNQVLMVWG